jgi:hypothetical protein
MSAEFGSMSSSYINAKRANTPGSKTQITRRSQALMGRYSAAVWYAALLLRPSPSPRAGHSAVPDPTRGRCTGFTPPPAAREGDAGGARGRRAAPPAGFAAAAAAAAGFAAAAPAGPGGVGGGGGGGGGASPPSVAARGPAPTPPPVPPPAPPPPPTPPPTPATAASSVGRLSVCAVSAAPFPARPPSPSPFACLRLASSAASSRPNPAVAGAARAGAGSCSGELLAPPGTCAGAAGGSAGLTGPGRACACASASLHVAAFASDAASAAWAWKLALRCLLRRRCTTGAGRGAQGRRGGARV